MVTGVLKKKLETVHLKKKCSQFYEDTVVVQVPVCKTCLRERRKQLGSRERKQD